MPGRLEWISGVAALGLATGAHATGCDLTLNVVDRDPAGLNVRAAPGGAILTALKARSQWIEVHVTGAVGAWARIDRATLIPEDQDKIRDLFTGVGYVAFSKIGFEYFTPGAEIRAAPQDGTPLLLTLADADDSHSPPAEVLGCSGRFIQVRVRGVVGWTRNVCTNQLTTCA